MEEDWDFLSRMQRDAQYTSEMPTPNDLDRLELDYPIVAQVWEDMIKSKEVLRLVLKATYDESN